MDPRAQETLDKSIWGLFKNFRFYYYVLSGMARREDPSCPTMGVGFLDGKVPIPTLVYNPEWIQQRSDPEMLVTLSHECLHVCLKHLERRGNRDPLKANMAMDVIVNHNIPQLNSLPEFRANLMTSDKFRSLHGVKLDDVTWEQVYELIEQEAEEEKQKMQQAMQNANSHDGWGKGKPQPGDGEGGEQKEVEAGLSPAQQAALNDLLKESVESLKGADPGNVPGSVRRAIETTKQVTMNWKQHLSIFAQSVAQEDKQPTWKRVSRRFGTMSPGSRKDYKPKLLVVIDNSGSVSKEIYDEFVGHVCKIADYCLEVDGIGVDTRVNFEFKFKRGKTPSHKDTQSGGGTLFQPAFDYAMGKGYDGIVYLTDGYNFDSGKLNTYKIPTIFAICPAGKEVTGHRNVKLSERGF